MYMTPSHTNLRLSWCRWMLSWITQRHGKTNQKYEAKQKEKNDRWVWSLHVCVQSRLSFQYRACQLVSIVGGDFTTFSFHTGLGFTWHGNAADWFITSANNHHTGTEEMVSCKQRAPPIHQLLPVVSRALTQVQLWITSMQILLFHFILFLDIWWFHTCNYSEMKVAKKWY